MSDAISQLCLRVLHDGNAIRAMEAPPRHPHTLLAANIMRKKIIWNEKYKNLSKSESSGLPHSHTGWALEKSIIKTSLNTLKRATLLTCSQKTKQKTETSPVHSSALMNFCSGDLDRRRRRDRRLDGLPANLGRRGERELPGPLVHPGMHSKVSRFEEHGNETHQKSLKQPAR